MLHEFTPARARLVRDRTRRPESKAADIARRDARKGKRARRAFETGNAFA